MLKYKTINLLCALLVIIAAGMSVFFHLSPWLLALPVLGYLSISAYGAIVLSAGFFIPVRYFGNKSNGTIAITFDDGPIPDNSEKVLAILKSYNAPAAFFCIGNRISSHPDILRKMHADGHLIGNHSYWHKSTFDLQTAAKIENELSSTNAVIHQTIGVKPRFFRPPYGVTNPMVAKAIKAGNFETIGWSVRSFDTISKDSDALFKRVTGSLRSGDVVLFHDYCSITLEILPRFLEFAATAGLKIVRLDELLNQKAYVTE